MRSFSDYMNEYRKQLEKGDIQKAYRGLMDCLMQLRSHFESQYHNYSISGIYQGYMDMTYFALFTESLKPKKLKVAIVFVYDKFRFEVWLAGQNKQVQTKYWELFKESGWNKYRVPSATRGVDFIIEGVLVENPDFGNLEALTKQIETGALNFIEDVEDFLSRH